MTDELYHYGIKGQRKGVRNGPPYPLESTKRKAKAAKTHDKVESIVRSLSANEKKLISMSPKDKEYLSIEDGKYVVHRTLKEIGNVPVSFFDALDDRDSINVTLATRSGTRYRGKGYGLEVARQTVTYLENHPNITKGRPLVWGVKTDNYASIAIAKKLGFTVEEGSEDNGWINYIKETKNG